MTTKILLQEPRVEDEALFIATMDKSKKFHFPFIVAPKTCEEFKSYLEKSKNESEKYLIAWDDGRHIIGVFNISSIVQGVFKSAFLGYYANVDQAGQGLMSSALKLVLREIFTNLDLHRIEANIQPTNTPSIHLATKNGFIKEGFSPRYLKINGIWQDHFRYALTKEDWLANNFSQN